MPDSHRTLRTSPIAPASSVVQGDTWRLTVLTDGLVRLEQAPDGVFEDRASAFALHRDLPTPAFRVVETGAHLEIVTERLHLTFDRGPFTTHGLSVQVRGGISSFHSIWRYLQPEDEHRAQFGGGNLGGTARTLDNVDGRCPLEPGVLSADGFAVVDDSATPLLEDDGWVRPRPGSAGEDAVGLPRVDLYVFAHGRDYDAALRDLHAVSGPQPLLPRWALGNWWSRYHRYSAQTYLELMDRFAAEHLPFSVAVIDMDWHLTQVDPRHGSPWTGYTWDRGLFPDPAAFLADLHGRGMRVTLNVHPADGVRAFEDGYVEMARALGREVPDDVEAGDPIPFDVTDRAFLDAYFDVLHRRLEDEGVDFWWIDWQSGPYSRLAGIDPLWVLNHFHFLDSGRDRRRPITFSRYAGPGSHRYPVGFSGDTVVTWASLDFQPEFTATAANIGYGWWSHDIGGHFFGVRDDELATRWLQLGTFSPVNRLHAGNNPFATKEPWTFGPRAEAVMGDFLRLRHRLVPYLHTMNHRTAERGLSVVRPMYHEHPWDDDAYRVPNQFLFGSALMVAPVTTPQDRATGLGGVTAWLPPGRWVDVLDGLAYDGDRVLRLHRPLESMPVLARTGSVVPLAAEPVAADVHPDAFEVLLVPGADGSFDLVEDDGRGDGGDPASRVVTPLRFDQASGRLTIGPATGDLSLVPSTRAWTVTVPGAGTAGRAAGPPGEPLVVSLGSDPQPPDADVPGRLFALLQRAQVEHDLKSRVHGVATSGRPLGVRLAQLQTMELPGELLSAVTELLTAH